MAGPILAWLAAHEPDRLAAARWALSPKEQERFRLRHFGFIFQGYNLFPALTARQQLEIILRWGEGVSGGEARRRAEGTVPELSGISF